MDLIVKHFITINERYHNESTPLERSVMKYGGVNGIPTLALNFHCGRNIYLFDPCGAFNSSMNY